MGTNDGPPIKSPADNLTENTQDHESSAISEDEA